jgi:carbon-monoxide dehydrogenase large subunit
MKTATKGSGAKWVGRAIRRIEDPALVTGRGTFTANLPSASWVRFVRSPVAAGNIRSITAPTDSLVVTARDLVGIKSIVPMLHKFSYKPIRQPILAKDVIRFVGECVAAVIAPTKEAAEDIAEAVDINIEALDPVIDARDALHENSNRLHPEAPRNIVVEGRFETSGFEAVRQTGHKIVKVDVRSRRQNALPLEARAGCAAFDHATGRVSLTCTTQMPHLTRTAIADVLGMMESDLRVIAPDVGGGFGQKMSLAPEYVLLVWLAKTYRRSFAWTEDRRENLIASFHSRDQYVALEGAFDQSGRLLSLSADILVNIGAYSCFPTTCGVEPLMAMAEMPGPYDVRHYRCVSRGVATNTCPMAPYRGVSRPVITLALERLMDQAAKALGMDPIEIRACNLIRTFPYTSATGLVFDEASYRETLDLAVERIDVSAFRKRQADERLKGRYLGLGLATFSERTGYGTPAFAARGMEITPGWEAVELSIDPSGTIEARIGASPHGQGLRTTLGQIIADQLGVNPADIRIIHGDTDRSPYGWGTFGSRSLVISGGATLIAAQKVRAKLQKIAGRMLEAAAEDIVLEDGAAKVGGTDRSIPISALARETYHRTHNLGNDIEPGIAEKGQYDPLGTFSNACHVAIVEVDVETGKVLVERFLVAEDAGLLINPMIADGQVAGGVAQGIGNALLEEIIYDDSGNILSSTLADYLPPTGHDIPTIEVHHLETHTSATNLGAKGLGEGGAIGAPAAVVNAINDALSPFGVSIDEMPVTPRRIWSALKTFESHE